MEKYSIIWTDFAKNEYYRTLEWWFELTQSYGYIEKIEDEVSYYEKLLIDNPKMGKEVIEEKQIRRVLILFNFSMFYRIDNNTIQIVSFFDNRQDPEKLNKLS